MDIDGPVTLADLGRLALLFWALWFSFHVGRVWEREVKRMNEDERSP